MTLEAPTPISEVCHSCPSSHRGGAGGRPYRTCRPFRNQQPARVHAHAGHQTLALRSRMASIGRDRPAGVGLEPVPCVPVNDGLHLRRFELVRDSAGEPVPCRVAGTARGDVAGSVRLDRRVHRREVRPAHVSARVPAASRSLLTGLTASATAALPPPDAMTQSLCLGAGVAA
jgi:hypothetical protein